MGLAEQPVPRSYHLQDNDWTPLSQNLCWKATIPLLVVFSRSDRLRPNTISNRLNGTKSNKSSVDDLDMELGIVRARVGLSYDPLRLSPSSGDLWFTIKSCAHALIVRVHPPPLNPRSNQPNGSTKQNNSPEKKPSNRRFSRLLQPFNQWMTGREQRHRLGGFFFAPFSEWSDPPPPLAFPWSFSTVGSICRQAPPPLRPLSAPLKSPLNLDTAKRWKVVQLCGPQKCSAPSTVRPPTCTLPPHQDPKNQARRNIPQRTTTTSNATPRIHGHFCLHVAMTVRPKTNHTLFGPTHFPSQLQWSQVRHWKMSEWPPPRSQLPMVWSKLTLECSAPSSRPHLPWECEMKGLDNDKASVQGVKNRIFDDVFQHKTCPFSTNQARKHKVPCTNGPNITWNLDYQSLFDVNEALEVGPVLQWSLKYGRNVVVEGSL